MNTIIPYKDNLCSKYCKKIISIKINSKCNMNCSFCVDKGGYIESKIDIEKISEQAIKLVEYKDVIITGGEPLLNFDEVVSLLKILRPHKDRLVLNTNGLLLTPDKVIKLNGLIDELQVSIHHFKEEINGKVFGRIVSFPNIQKCFSLKKFETSINSTFNKSIKRSEYKKFLEKMCILVKNIGADRLRITELKRVSEDDFLGAKLFLPNDNSFAGKSDNELIQDGCSYNTTIFGVPVRIKRLCKYAKGNKSIAFSCCFITSDGQKKFDVDTAETFRVIYGDGTVSTDWIF